MSQNEEPCRYHPELIKYISAHSAHLRELRVDVAQVKAVVTKINESLIGTLDNPGLIGRLCSADEKSKAAIDDLVQWRAGIDNLVRSMVFKLVSVAVGAVVGGAVIAVAVVRAMGAF